MRFLMLNLDDYFWSLVEHPTDWINDRNYETPEAMDIQLLNSHLIALLEGQTVEKPIYSFRKADAWPASYQAGGPDSVAGLPARIVSADYGRIRQQPIPPLCENQQVLLEDRVPSTSPVSLIFSCSTDAAGCATPSHNPC
jgi:hypothetical protein